MHSGVILGMAEEEEDHCALQMTQDQSHPGISCLQLDSSQYIGLVPRVHLLYFKVDSSMRQCPLLQGSTYDCRVIK